MKIGTLDVSEDQLGALCRRWQVSELAVLGSVLCDDFGPESDVDLLVTFAPDAPWTLFDLVTIRDDFANVLGRPVDLIERSTIETSPNWNRREILGTAQPVHVPG